MKPFARTFILFVALCTLALLILLSPLACSKKQPESKEMKIGAILPLTGDIAAYGENCKNGIDLAVDEINSGGGLDGKKVRVVYEDSQGLPQIGVAAIQKLINKDTVSTIIGDVTSGVTLSIAPIANKNKVVILSPGASSPKVTEAGDYIFRNWQSDSLEAEVMAKYALEKGYGDIAIMYINNDFGKALDETFSKIFVSKGGKILINEAFEQNEKDFRTHLLKIKIFNPQAIYLLSYPQETPLILQQAKELGLNAQFLGVAAFEDGSLIKIAGKLADGVVYTFAIPPSDEDPTVANFKKNYYSKYSKGPGLTSDTGYDAIKMIVLTIKLGGGFSGDDIKEGLYKIKDFHGASGIMSFDRNGDVVKPIGLKTVQDGKFVWISR